MVKKERIPVIDILTMMATIIVVMGHHKFLRPMVDWYFTYDKIIYSFHMGFFMTLSGFLIRYSFPTSCCWKNYWGKKFKKFVPAYFAVGLIASLLTFKSMKLFGYDMLMLLISPTKGSIQIIWYIYVLLIFYALSPIVFKLTTKGREYLFFVSLLMAVFYPYMPKFFCINQEIRMFPFFLIGSIFCDNRGKIKMISDTYLFLLSLPFLIFCGLRLISCKLVLYGDIEYLICSLSSLPFMYFIARQFLKFPKVVNMSRKFSSYVFPIYLLQMFFINAWNLIRIKLNIILTNTTAILYLIVSVVLTIVSIVYMVKLYRLCIKILKMIIRI